MSFQRMAMTKQVANQCNTQFPAKTQRAWSGWYLITHAPNRGHPNPKDFIYAENFIQAERIWTPATKDNRRISLERQRKSKERAVKLLRKHLAEVDIIEKDILQGWPQVSAHFIPRDEQAAEQRVGAAVGVFFFPACTEAPPQLPCVPSLNMATTKTQVHFTNYRNVTKLCRPPFSNITHRHFISGWCLQVRVMIYTITTVYSWDLEKKKCLKSKQEI